MQPPSEANGPRLVSDEDIQRCRLGKVTPHNAPITPADRDAYLQVKRDLAKRTWRYVQHYADAKTAIVEQIIARATAHRRAPRPD